MADTFAAIDGGAWAEIFASNPDFDLLHFDFHDGARVAQLNVGSLERSAASERLKVYQRVLRLHDDAAVADRLIAQGFDSAHSIAALPHGVFVRQIAANGVSAEAAADIHRRAVSVKAAAQHLHANIRDLVAAPHYRSTRAFNVAASIAATAGTIPSYQDLFGSLDYITCSHCESIFGPAAYFLDLMRIIEAYVTGANNIPAEYRLRTRRPDLFDLPLDCDNTDRLVPYLQVVNRVLEQHIAGGAGTDPYKTLAAARFPFNLPFALPLVETRDSLTALSTSLAAIYAALMTGDRAAPAAGASAIAREFLGLSLEQLAVVSTPQTTATGLGPCYGYVEITDDIIAALSRVSAFLERTGLTRDQLIALLQQETSREERETVAPTFFINATDETNPSFMSIVVDEIEGDVFERIDGLTLRRLDRINRFVRLQAVLGWSYADLDWAMKSVDATEIAPAIEPFAGIKQLVQSTALTVPQIASSWYVVKNIGTGAAAVASRIDLFDRVFNNPALLQGRNPYASGEDVPFDPQHPLTWRVDGSSLLDTEIRARLGAALLVSDDDLTRLADYLTDLAEPAERTLTTDLPTLSAFYRLAGAARAAALTVGEYLMLLRLIGGAAGASAGHPRGPAARTVADVVAERETIAWVKAAGFGTYELAYIITGDGHGYVDPGYRVEDIASFLASLATASIDARLTPASFVYETIDSQASADVFDFLRGSSGGPSYITQSGIVTASPVTFAVLATAQPVHQDDLVTALISVAEARSAFADLVANEIILAATGASEGPISQAFGPATSLDFLFADDPRAPEKRDQVREALGASKSGVEHSLGVMAAARTLQGENAQAGLAAFLGATVEATQVLLPFAAGTAGVTDFLAALLTPLPLDGAVPAGVPKLIAVVARALALMRKIDLTATEAQAVIRAPATFGIADTARPTLLDVRSLWTFKSLVLAFNDTTGRLIAFLAMPDASDGEKTAKLAVLATLTGWPVAQIAQLVDWFWGSGAGYSTVAGVARLKQVLDLAAQTGLRVQSLMTLNGLADLPLAVGGAVVEDNWKTYRSAAGATFDAVAAKYAEPDRTEVLTTLQESLVEKKRDALVGFAIFQIGHTVPAVRQPSDLYPYLLIDVEMTSCDTISYVAQGIGSLQLYLQRARLDQEPGVTGLPIPDAWWDWMASYRTWEANRKVFLYPESYIDPSLRAGAAPQFDALKTALLQNEISAAYVADAYRSYMDEFASLADLKIAATCRYHVPDPNSGQTVDTLFIFGRTNTEPYVYYLRRCEHYSIVNGKTQARWTPWRKMDVAVPSPWITPVYAFGKLMIFWTEIDKSRNAVTERTETHNRTAWKAQIRFSFVNFRDEWVQPQTYAGDIIVSVDPDKYVSESPFAAAYDPAVFLWRKPCVIRMPAGSYSGASPFGNSEQLLVLYGPAAPYASNRNYPVVEPDPTPFPDEDRLNDEIHRGAEVLNAMQRSGLALPGMIPLKGAVAVAPNLIQQDLTIAWTGTYPLVNFALKLLPVYSGKLLPAGRTLLAAGYETILEAEYYADAAVGSGTGPVPLDVASSGAAAAQPVPAATGTQPAEGAVAAAAAPAALPPDQALLVNLAATNTSMITVKNQPGWFVFDNGDDVFLATWQRAILRTVDSIIVASAPYQAAPAYITGILPREYTSASATEPPPPLDQTYAFTRLGTHTVDALSQTLFTGGIDALLRISSQQARELPFSRFYPGGGKPKQVINTTTDQLDFNGAYGLYFWDIFFHAVFLVADGLKNNRRYAEAKAWYEYIFNPTAKAGSGSDHPNDRFWQFLPFRGLTWESLMRLLTDVGQIAAYNDDPFNPHAIARLRPSAYPKAIVMHYIDVLLEWGDMLFAQDTRESITQATNLYLLAAELLGSRPRAVASFARKTALSYAEIAAAYSARGTARAGTASTITLATDALPKDAAYNGLTIALTGGKGAKQTRRIVSYVGATRVATVSPAWSPDPPDKTTTYQMSGIPQFLIELENTAMAAAAARGSVAFAAAPFNDVDSYFCIPENEEFVAYWDRVEDRLYKIRHCMNIHGVVRQLALFEPPLDVRALVRAAATGNLGAAIAAPTAQAVPFYRFAAMLEKAKALTSALTGLGGSLLSALQQADGEALALLSTTQERVVLDLSTKLRSDAIEEIAAQRNSLNESRAAAQLRATYYRGLVAGGLSSGERANLDALAVAFAFNIAAGIYRAASAVGYALPQAGSPTAITYGGQQVGAMLSAVSGAAEIGATVANFVADRSLTMAGYDRRADDWTLQADLADADLRQIDAQIAASDINAQIARQELLVHQKTIQQNAEMEAFLRRKFTSQELFQWLAGRLATIHFQTYSLAFDLALAAQRAYQFERNTDRTFVNFDYWDSARKGLAAGEGLTLALQQMESAYLAGAGGSLEIERTISLLETNPEALLDLQRTGECTFALSQRLFDQDYPGHYARTIKTIAISLPAIVGPYQNVKATLTQTSNRIALRDDIATARYLLGVDRGAAPGADRLRSGWMINQQIALSSGVDDDGRFILDFEGQRYLPFEGTGAVSTWTLSMPKAANRIDYAAISDVVVQLSYTARDGGGRLRDQVVKLAPVKDYSAGRFYLLAQQWPEAWFAFMQDHAQADSQSLSIPLTAAIAPPQVDVSAVVGVALHLQVKDGNSAAGNYIEIFFPGDTSGTKIAIDGRTNSGRVDKRITSYAGNWKLSFALGTNGAPASITDGKYLDPAKLKNIAMIVYYEGTLDWA